jgi:hypothetical protein
MIDRRSAIERTIPTIECIHVLVNSVMVGAILEIGLGFVL